MQNNNTGQSSSTMENTNKVAEGPGGLDHLSDDEVIDYYIRGIMQEKGVEAPTPEIEQDIFENLKTNLLEQIDRSLIAELPDDKLDKLNDIATKDGRIEPEIIAKMIEESHLDVTAITGQTMARFREIYLGQETSNKTEE